MNTVPRAGPDAGDLLGRFRRARRCGSGYVAHCPAHDDRKRSLSITVRDGRVFLHCFAGCGFREILQAANLTAADLRVEGEAAPAWSREERIAFARRLWERTRPASGTVVEQYLRNRCILESPPPAIRHIPLLHHREYGWPFPCLAAGLQDVTRSFTGVSITWLAADGSDKAPVGEPARKVFGVLGGSAVRLAAPTDALVICEGVETGLAIQQATKLPVWSALSASNLPRVEVPTCVNKVIIAADGDEAGELAALAAAKRLLSEGREVRIARPGRAGADFNDLRV
jgi:putative DNA primase/helicase